MTIGVSNVFALSVSAVMERVRLEEASMETRSSMETSARSATELVGPPAVDAVDTIVMVLDENFAPKHDAVNHPKHYTGHPSGVECIVITRHMNFNLGNVVKYVWRAGHKDEAPTIQDLEKAAWYLNDEIERRKKEEECLTTATT